MNRIEFIYDSNCPNVTETRENLIKALTSEKLPLKWTEYDRNDPSSPEYASKYGSPTILIDGQDLVGEMPSDANNCRIYPGEEGNSGIPSPLLIRNALLGNTHGWSSRWKSTLGAVPGVGIVLLPKLTCAACWPAYAAIMSSMGVGFFNYTEYLFPISVIALALTLVALGYRAHARRGYHPLILGTVGSLVALVGKFYFLSDSVFYVGVALLVAASIWNGWPRKQKNKPCSAC